MRFIKNLFLLAGVGAIVFLIGILTAGAFLDDGLAPHQKRALILPNLGIWGGSAAFAGIVWLTRRGDNPEGALSYWLAGIMPLIYALGAITYAVMFALGMK